MADDLTTTTVGLREEKKRERKGWVAELVVGGGKIRVFLFVCFFNVESSGSNEWWIRVVCLTEVNIIHRHMWESSRVTGQWQLITRSKSFLPLVVREDVPRYSFRISVIIGVSENMGVMCRNTYNSLKFKEHLFIWAMFKCFVFLFIFLQKLRKKGRRWRGRSRRWRRKFFLKTLFFFFVFFDYYYYYYYLIIMIVIF